MSDVALAFLEYDEELTWPEGSGITFTQHCAPKAWANGWRLGTQIDMIRKVVNEVRSEAGLPLATNWPMLTFEKFVYTVARKSFVSGKRVSDVEISVVAVSLKKKT